MPNALAMSQKSKRTPFHSQVVADELFFEIRKCLFVSTNTEMGGENLVLSACTALDIVHPLSTLTSERDVQVLFVSQGQSLNTEKQTNKARGSNPHNRLANTCADSCGSHRIVLLTIHPNQGTLGVKLPCMDEAGNGEGEKEAVDALYIFGFPRQTEGRTNRVQQQSNKATKQQSQWTTQ